MSGRIAAADIATVRERVRIDEVVSEHVTLRAAGGGSLKGLCPFHDERSPSFHVTPAKGLYYCFGCGVGGDAIEFVMAMDHLTFHEAVEKLAARVGVQLRIEGGGAAAAPDQGRRAQVVAVNAAAATYFADQLPKAAHATDFLESRGFPAEVWERFGVGYAPRQGLVSHLRDRGFSQQAIVASGVAGQGEGRTYDRFRDRVVWPIRDVSGDVVGFGARRLSEDAGPKYLNTPETVAYKKSQVLYGVYEARRTIAREHQVVVVEGYTDVMACHLAGVDTAVATCGTAFGEGHVKVLRRLLLDDASAQVVFTFDGDAAGRKAALRAYEEDQQFAARTYVAIAADNLDPCDLRLRDGDQGVRDLVSARTPLFEFVLRSTLADLDLRTAEGRAAGVRAVAPVIAGLKDATLRPEYARQVAGWLGTDTDQVMAAVGARGPTRGALRPAPPRPPAARGTADQLEAQALQVILQQPEQVADWLESLDAECFTDPTSRDLFAVIVAAGPPSDGPAWLTAILDRCDDDDQRGRIRSLVSRPLPTGPEAGSYGVGVLARLLDRTAARRVGDLRAALGEPEAQDDAARQAALLADLMSVEEYRRSLRSYWAGD
ncbi:MAG: DNA primase [Candidatus Nanopelagicales bacterium]